LGLKNLPRVAIHDILVHPRENDLVLATHGRSVWIFDDAAPIQQITPELVGRDLHLFDLRPAVRLTTRFTRYGIGDKIFTGPNPPAGALITYYLKEKPDEKTTVKLQVFDSSGKMIREITQTPKERGLNRAAWDLNYEGPRLRRQPTPEETAFTGGPRGPQALPGAYTVRLIMGDKSQEKRVEVRLDPTVTIAAADLQAQFDHALKLRDMLSATNNALRSLDSIKEQLQQTEKTIKDRLPDAPRELTNTITEHLKQVEALQNRLSAPQEGLGFRGQSQLAEKIGSLFSSIDGVNAAPTPAQREFFADIQLEFRARMDEVNKFINQTVPQLNDALRRHSAPTVIAGKPIELPR
jgi:hypothetical protein